jgi:hypothetical protein
VNGTTDALEAALAEVRSTLPSALAEADRTARLLADLLDEEHGLQLTLMRQAEPAAREDYPAIPPTEDWIRLSQVDTVLRILTELRHPMSARAIATALRRVGRSETSAQVRSALVYLKRLGLVSWQSRARWAANGSDGACNAERA